MELIKLDLSNKNEVKDFFREVFTKDPWNDDWSDEEQLDNYIDELCVKTELQGQGIGGKFVAFKGEFCRFLIICSFNDIGLTLM